MNESHHKEIKYTKDDFLHIIKSLIDYEENKKINFFSVRALKQENDIFINLFKKIQSLNPNGILGNSEEKIKLIFGDLIDQYKAKGYGKIDFMNRNFLESEPLLIFLDNIKQFYEAQSPEILLDDPNRNYLEKIFMKNIIIYNHLHLV